MYIDIVGVVHLLFQLVFILLESTQNSTLDPLLLWNVFLYYFTWEYSFTISKNAPIVSRRTLVRKEMCIFEKSYLNLW